MHPQRGEGAEPIFLKFKVLTLERDLEGNYPPKRDGGSEELVSPGGTHTRSCKWLKIKDLSETY